MNAKTSRQARRIANEYATRNKLWDKGTLPKRPWWDRLLDKLLPKRRATWQAIETDMRGQWYKRTLKHIAKQAAARMHDRDYAEMDRVRRKLAKERRK